MFVFLLLWFGLGFFWFWFWLVWFCSVWFVGFPCIISCKGECNMRKKKKTAKGARNIYNLCEVPSLEEKKNQNNPLLDKLMNFHTLHNMLTQIIVRQFHILLNNFTRHKAKINWLLHFYSFASLYITTGRSFAELWSSSKWKTCFFAALVKC